MNRIHPTAVIGADVQVGDCNVIGPYTVILGPCQIGNDNWIGPHVVIGTPGEMRGGAHPAAWDGEPGAGPIIIGDRNVLREFTTVQQGWSGRTEIGSDCYIMDKVHVAHDNLLGDRVTLSCAVMLAGHVVIDDGANVGLSTVAHQRVVIGAGAMVGMGSVITKHLLPYALAFGSPCRVHRANTVGLQRAGVDQWRIDAIDAAMRQEDEAALAELLAEEVASFRAHVAHVST